MVATRSSARQAGKRAAETLPEGEGERDVKRVTKAMTKPKAPKKTSMSAPLASGQHVDWDITLVDEEGGEVRLADLTKDRGVVLFMYPRANTPGCTKQACGFRDHYQDIRDAGFDVYGLGGDSPKSLTSWKTKQELPYKLLSDPKHELIKRLGSSVGGSKVQRSHVVLLKGGIVGDIQPRVSPAESVERAVAYVTSLKKDEEAGDGKDKEKDAPDHTEKEGDGEEEEDAHTTDKLTSDNEQEGSNDSA